MADFIENPGKYQLPEEFLEPQREREEQRATRTAKRQKALEVEQGQLLDEIEAMKHMSAEQQWEAQKGTLQLYLRKRLNKDQWERLEEHCKRGEIEAATLARTLAAAVSTASLDAEVDQLRRSLNPLPPL